MMRARFWPCWGLTEQPKTTGTGTFVLHAGRVTSKFKTATSWSRVSRRDFLTIVFSSGGSHQLLLLFWWWCSGVFCL
eukprot:scaffold27769_cov176-Amphora_coffeaeformis.AAC.3